MSNEAKSNPAPAAATEHSPEVIGLMRGNAKLGLIVGGLSGIILWGAIVAFTYQVSVRNEVVILPSGEQYDYPLVSNIQVTAPQEESRRFLFTAMRYIKMLYEIDVNGMSSVGVAGVESRVSSGALDAMSYVVPGSAEEIRVRYLLRRSRAFYEEMKDCQCRMKLNVEDIRVTDVPDSPFKRVEVLGYFENINGDPNRPIPSEYIGYKLFTLVMFFEGPAYQKENTKAVVYSPKNEASNKEAIKEEGGIIGFFSDDREQNNGIAEQEARYGVSRKVQKSADRIEVSLTDLPKNVEGWFVISSTVQDMNDEAIRVWEKIGIDLGLKTLE